MQEVVEVLLGLVLVAEGFVELQRMPKHVYVKGMCGTEAKSSKRKIRVFLCASGVHFPPRTYCGGVATQVATGRVQIWSELQLCTWRS
jgi:hypothetical protein